jgi:hypothetical protein
MEENLFLSEMIRSELSEIVGPDFVSVAESDKFIYSTDWAWMPQMWLDRGKKLRPPDYIVYPVSAEENSEILGVAYKYRIPVVPWGGGSGMRSPPTPPCRSVFKRFTRYPWATSPRQIYDTWRYMKDGR